MPTKRKEAPTLEVSDAPPVETVQMVKGTCVVSVVKGREADWERQGFKPYTGPQDKSSILPAQPKA